MKIKLASQGKESPLQTKPANTAVVAPHGVQCPGRSNVHPEFASKTAVAVSVLYILSAIIGIVVAAVVHAKLGGCGWHLHTGFIASIVAGGLGLGAAFKKRRGLIIAFLVFAAITLVIVVMSGAASVKALAYLRHRQRIDNGGLNTPHGDRHHGDRRHGDRHHGDRDDQDKQEWMKKKMEWMRKHKAWHDRKHHSHDRDEDDKRRPRPEGHHSEMSSKKFRHIAVAGAISLGVLHLVEFVISIIAIVISCRVVGCCRKRQRQTNSACYQMPSPVVVESAPLPAELDAKILAEENYMSKQAPPTSHQEDVPVYEPPPYVENDKTKLTDVNV